MKAGWNESKNDENEFSYSCYLFEEQLFAETLHAHDRFELVLIVKGEGNHQFGAQSRSFRPGSVMLLGPGILHSFTTDQKGHGLEAIVVHFPKAVLPQGLLNIVEARPIKALLERAKMGLVFDAKDPERIRNRMQALLRSRGMFRIARLHVLLELIAQQSDLQVSNNQLHSVDLSRASARLFSVKRFLDERCASPIGREDAAAFLGMDVASFSRFFRSAAGVTFSDYLANLRVQKAARWLTVRKDFSVKDVARRSGFHNISTFNKQFRNRLGMTPIAYRKAADIEQLAP